MFNPCPRKRNESTWDRSDLKKNGFEFSRTDEKNQACDLRSPTNPIKDK